MILCDGRSEMILCDGRSEMILCLVGAE